MILSNDSKFNKTFLIACGLLLVGTLSWEWMMTTLKWYTRKERIEWPAHVVIDEEEFYNRSFPKSFGERYDGAPRYTLGSPEDQMLNKINKFGQDGIPDGYQIFRADLKESLKIGIGQDKPMVLKRKSNWYLSRTYEDRTMHEMPKAEGDLAEMTEAQRKAACEKRDEAWMAMGEEQRRSARRRQWHLSVDYYTSSELGVPHVPEKCSIESGATLKESGYLTLEFPSLPKPWRKVEFKALTFTKRNAQSGKIRTFTQYYLFSCNGRPETDRLAVRATVKKLTVRYVYYSKIQFNLLHDTDNPEKTNELAKDFLRNVLPEILTQIPSAETVDKLNS
ncbi:MAG: hypothetical protein HN909_02915 [Phycisphaerales bacterium]|jgi:hypothetical protein|nr:hypothetical protein [Phycisphaerales bacterium]MBT7170703.1 hypothetical protein [Phycisphaerales bacterium]